MQEIKKKDDTMKTGIFKDFNEKEYHSVEALSFSGIKEMIKSPAHYKVFREQKEEFDKQRHFFRSIHLAVLEPNKIQTHISIVDGHGATKSVKEARELAVLSGKVCIDSEMADSLVEIKKNVLFHEVSGSILENSSNEVSIFWHDEELDIPCKARIDIMTTQGTWDLKSFSKLHNIKLLRSHILDMGYNIQAAWYRRGLKALGKGANEAGLILVNPEKPYNVATYKINEASIIYAQETINEAARRYKECRESGEFNVLNNVHYDDSEPVTFI